MAEALERTAVLVIRVWFEEGTAGRSLRARITETPDVSASELTATSAAASEQEVVRAVRAWLRALTAGR
jgi:hypothetical protein